MLPLCSIYMEYFFHMLPVSPRADLKKSTLSCNEEKEEITKPPTK